jgi:exonuclease SbcD
LKFLHAADVHLDSPLRGLRRKTDAPADEIRSASRRALENLTNLAIRETVDFVVVAGDLFDGDRDNYDSSLFFVRQAAKLKEAGIPLLLIWGNHDAQSKMMRSVTWPENVKVFPANEAATLDAETLGVDAPIAVHGWSFATASEQRNLVRQYPRPIHGVFNLGLLHTSLTGAEGHDSYAPCTLEDLAAREYDYWALGHIHLRDWLPRPLDEGAAPVVFPGNLQGRHIKETGAKGGYLIEALPGAPLRREFHPLDVFRWETLRMDATDCASPDDFWEECSRSLQRIAQDADGRRIAIRIYCTGQGGTFDFLAARHSRLEAELTRILVDHFDEQFWLEGVRCEASAASAPAEALSDTLTEYLQRELASLHDSEGVKEYAEIFDALVRKLPPELEEEYDIRDGTLASSTLWRDAIADAQTLLWARLRERGAGSEATR